MTILSAGAAGEVNAVFQSGWNVLTPAETKD